MAACLPEGPSSCWDTKSEEDERIRERESQWEVREVEGKIKKASEKQKEEDGLSAHHLHTTTVLNMVCCDSFSSKIKTFIVCC